MYLVAVFMGLTGGLHCLGMCGPLVMGATLNTPFIYARLIYATGRILTYGMLGLLTGALGGFIRLTQYQHVLSFSLGVMLLLMGFYSIRKMTIPLWHKTIWRLIAVLKNTFNALLKRPGKWKLFILGMLNGLIPCGLTYLAMAYCLTLDHSWKGMLFMLVFGASTLPMTVGFFGIFQWLGNWIKPNYAIINTILWVVSGVILIGRSLFSHLPENMQTGSQSTGWEILCR